MFLAIVCIAIGIAILLNTLGIATGSMWGFFWAIIFIAIGIRLLFKKGCCSMCGWQSWKGKMHDKTYEGCCGHSHEEE